MKTSTQTDQPALALAEKPKQAIATTTGQNAGMQAAGVLEFIDRAARDANFDVTKFERLLALQREVLAEQRLAEFNDSLARVQALMPHIEQSGAITYAGKNGGQPTRIPYAKLEDIDTIIRPMYSAEGFSVTWNTKPLFDGKLIEVTGTFRHRSGHCESLSLALGPDDSGGKNNVQARASTVAYAKRHLTKMFWNIIEKGLDVDGSDIEPISKEQVDTLRDKINEVKGNMAGFMKLMKVSRLEDILNKDLNRAYGIIDDKRRN